MKRITKWLIKRYLPGHTLIEVSPEAVRALVEERLKGFHLSRNPVRVKREEQSGPVLQV